MAEPEPVLLSETRSEGYVTIRSRFEMDRAAGYRLKIAWATARTALAMANACPIGTLTNRVACREAQNALDPLF